MCRRSPCAPTPQEVERLLEHGYGGYLAINEWNDVVVVRPRTVHEIGRPMTDLAKVLTRLLGGPCAFLRKGRCLLHDAGMKPLEGRTAHHDQIYDGFELRDAIADAWTSRRGESLVRKVRRWKR